jgi:phosphatidylglycerophosphate synthase
VLKARFGADFDRVVLGVFPFISRIRIQPDTLTALGVAVSLVAALAFAMGHMVWGGVALFGAGFFDVIDGVVARSQGREGASGGFFDSSMDRLSELLAFSGMAIGMARNADPWGVLLVCWALTGSVMTSYTRARAERHLAHFSVGVMERGERLVLIILGALTGWLEVALGVVAVGATLTSIQRVVVARRLLRELDRTGQDPTSREIGTETG